MCASWKDSDDERVRHTKVNIDDVRDDLKVTQKLNQLLQECADKNRVIVYQNGDKFDYKKIRARSRFHRLDPLPELKRDLLTIDTLKEARKSGFDYNRLDYLDKHLHGHEYGKVETKGWLMWRDIVSRYSDKNKQRQALKEMVKYCDGDILALERVFNTLLPDIRLPNKLLFYGQVDGCPQCGSHNYSKNGTRITLTRVYQSYICKDCKKRFQDTKSMRGSVFK